MNSHLIAPGIRFNDCVFSEPRHVGGWMPPKCGGIFVLLVSDFNWAPRPFQPLCFVEFGNNSRENSLAGHHAGLAVPGISEGVFVAVFPMPFSTTAERCAVRNQLVWAYNPVWQANGNPAIPMELARKVDELEKKHEEQTTEIRLLLESIRKFFEPQPEPPRGRPIGFLHQTASA